MLIPSLIALVALILPVFYVSAHFCGECGIIFPEWTTPADDSILKGVPG
jgi:hypothetical protein